MKKHFLKRSFGFALALMLVLSALPVTALAAETPASDFVELVATDVWLDETVFEHTGREIMPNVTVRVDGTLLTLDKHYKLEYADNIEVGTGKVIVTGVATEGYIGTVEVPFYINEKAPEEPEFTLIELTASDVSISGTEFPYTGEAIEPAVTVTAEGQTLTAGKDYSVEYVNNVEVGTATVIVRGIATASQTLGYTGAVSLNFTIQATQPEEYPLVEIQHSDVTINGKQFTYTGKAIEPEITVTVDGKVLTAGKDYSLKYENNVEVGTGYAIVSGIATATQTGGYTGQVTVRFTIVPMTEETYPLVEIKSGDVTIDGTKFTYTGKAIEPKITVTVDGKVLTAGKDYSLKYVNNVEVGTATAIVSGIATATQTGGYTGEVKVNFTIAEAPKTPDYQITKGNGAKWYQESGTSLSFTANGDYSDFIGISINGKRLEDSNYTVKSGSTVITLKNSYLKKLDLGTYTITVHYTDGEAEGTFQVLAASENPKTGDTGIHLWVATLFVSLTGLAGAAFVCRKKFFK